MPHPSEVPKLIAWPPASSASRPIHSRPGPRSPRHPFLRRDGCFAWPSAASSRSVLLAAAHPGRRPRQPRLQRLARATDRTRPGARLVDRPPVEQRPVRSRAARARQPLRPAAAEKIAVSAAVLIFFWGAFALASAAARRAAWLVAPCLAMVAYGWTFQMGFFNYYLSLGFAFFGLALLWRGRGWERAAVLPLVPLIWLAHPLGVVLLAGAGAWIVVAETRFAARPIACRRRRRGGADCVRFYIVGRYQVFRSREPRYFFNGADQLLLYGPQYRWPLILLLAFGLAASLSRSDAAQSNGANDFASRVPPNSTAWCCWRFCLLPETIVLPQYAAPAGFLHERLSCICAIFACCVLASLKPRKVASRRLRRCRRMFSFSICTETPRKSIAWKIRPSASRNRFRPARECWRRFRRRTARAYLSFTSWTAPASATASATETTSRDRDSFACAPARAIVSPRPA